MQQEPRLQLVLKAAAPGAECRGASLAPAGRAANPAPWSHPQGTITRQVDPSITGYRSKGTAVGDDLLVEVAIGWHPQSRGTQAVTPHGFQAAQLSQGDAASGRTQ